MMISQARNIIFGFENIHADCPHCGEKCVYNRRSDLNTHEAIAGMAVPCLHCRQDLWLLGDSVNDKCHFLLGEARDSLQGKKYMATVIYSCMALERFFTFYLEHHFGLHNELDPADLVCSRAQRNADWKIFGENMKKATYFPLRGGFIKICCGTFPAGINDDWGKELGTPSPDIIKGVSNNKLRRLLRILFACQIGDLRNSVGHKIAYRPTKDEAKRVFKSTEKLMNQLAGLLYHKYNDCP